MRRLIYILTFMFLIAYATESCSKLDNPTLRQECGTPNTSDDPTAATSNINDNSSEKDITDSEDDEDQDRDINSD